MAINTWLAELKKDATPTMDECVSILGDSFPLLYDFKQTEQDPEWHAEGNVHIHLDMVMQALYELLATDAEHIQGERRQALILGTLLHDIAKPLTTRRMEIRGIERVVATRHEERGCAYLAYKLVGLGLSFYVIDLVLNLVGLHHIPKQLVMKNRDYRAYFTLSRKADCELLYFLEVADMTGRICPDKAKQIEYLDVFKMFCEEYDIWPNRHWSDQWMPYFKRELSSFDVDTQDLIVANAILDRERGLISTPEEAVAKSYQYRDAYAKLVVMCGPSGSGKSTWIEQNLDGYVVISLDNIREKMNGDRRDQTSKGQVIQEAKRLLKYHLAQHDLIVWDATNLRKDFRDMIIGLGYAYNALVTLVIFHKSESSFIEGNRQRKHSVPAHVLQKQIDFLQWPERLEAHRVLFIGEKNVTVSKHGYYAMSDV